jgi:N-acetylmuramoyl-L-alanine amidase
MVQPPARDQETRELIQRFQARRERRRRLRILLACLVGAVVVALIVTAVVLATQGPGGQAATTGSAPLDAVAGGGPLTTEEAAGGGSGGSGDPTTTTGDPSTTTRSTMTTPHGTTTSLPATTTTVAPTTTAPPPAGKVVVIDPGHQARGNSNTEPVGPGSNEMKPKVSSGTAGVATGIPESELVSLLLRDALAAQGVEVIMTRTTQDVDISNVERAQIANAAGADLFVRIHADGSDNSATSGIHVLYPASIKGWTDDIAAASKEAASIAQRELIAATGAADRGIDARSDMTGFNWADVPVILPEIGFMTNPDEDRRLATPAYQDKIVQGLTRAILAFLGVQ